MAWVQAPAHTQSAHVGESLQLGAEGLPRGSENRGFPTQYPEPSFTQDFFPTPIFRAHPGREE